MKKAQKSQRKKQQRALKKRSQRKQKLTRKQAQTAVLQSPARIIRRARAFPIEGCWAQRDWRESGIAMVVVARSQPNGDVAFGTYVVDYYCLGVKDTFCNANIPSDRFHNEVLPRIYMGQPPVEIPPELAHEIIYGAVDYAAQFEFRPHRGFARSRYILDPPDAHPRTGAVEFGRDGKPLYVSGPHDNSRVIINKLARTAGEGNFGVLVGAPPPEDEYGFEPVDEGEADDFDDAPRPALWTPGRARGDDESTPTLWTPGR